MATWHQRQARRRPGFSLQHATKWSIVTDPANEMCGIYLCATEAEAKETLTRWLANDHKRYLHSFILPPTSV